MALILSSLLPYIAPDVRRCPQPILIQSLRIAINEFMRDTQLWQRDMTAVDIVAEQTTYSLPATFDPLAEVEMVVSATYDDEEMVQGSHYEMTDELTLELLFDPPEAVTGGLVIRAIHRLAPAMETSAEGLTDAVLERIVSSWIAAIVEKAKSILFIMRDKPWTDEKKAIVHDQLYQGLKTNAVIRKIQKHTNAPVQIAYRRFA